MNPPIFLVYYRFNRSGKGHLIHAGAQVKDNFEPPGNDMTQLDPKSEWQWLQLLTCCIVIVAGTYFTIFR